MSTLESASLGPARSGRRNDTIRIRTLTPEDLRSWIRLRRALWPAHTLQELTRDAEMLLESRSREGFRRASKLATVLLAKGDSGEVVGFAEVVLRPYADGCRSSPVGYLEGWYVKPRYRRSGVGRALVRAAEGWARSRGCTEMASDAKILNSTSRTAHRALGYREVARLVHFRRDLRKKGS